MKALSYAWTILVGLVTVGIVALLFSRDFQPFERTTISLLALIYLNANIVNAVMVKSASEAYLALLRWNLRIESGLLGRNEQIEDERHALDEHAREMQQVEVKYLISLAFNSLGGFIALANLLRAVLF